jgi:rubredoxin
MIEVDLQRPTLWRCTNCLYGFWSHGKEQDPIHGHCSSGWWVYDEAAIDVLVESLWNGWEREYWMAP